MAENQGARIVTCPKHGIPYDASKRGGCSRCIREWERQKGGRERSDSGLPTSIKLLGLLLVVAGFYYVLSRPPGGGGEAPPAAAPVPQASVAAVADEETEQELRRVVDTIPGLIADGRAETEYYLADADDPVRQREDWEFWSVDWTGRVEKLAEKMPERPDSQDYLKLALVHQEVSRALEELRAVPGTTLDGQPDATGVAKRFQTAEVALQQARLYLSQLNR